jgi:hypothetical protein
VAAACERREAEIIAAVAGSTGPARSSPAYAATLDPLAKRDGLGTGHAARPINRAFNVRLAAAKRRSGLLALRRRLSLAVASRERATPTAEPAVGGDGTFEAQNEPGSGS